MNNLVYLRLTPDDTGDNDTEPPHLRVDVYRGVRHQVLRIRCPLLPVALPIRHIKQQVYDFLGFKKMHLAPVVCVRGGISRELIEGLYVAFNGEPRPDGELAMDVGVDGYRQPVEPDRAPKRRGANGGGSLIDSAPVLSTDGFDKKPGTKKRTFRFY